MYFIFGGSSFITPVRTISGSNNGNNSIPGSPIAIDTPGYAFINNN